MTKYLKIIVFVILLSIIYFSFNPIVLDYSESSLNLAEINFEKGDEFTLNDLLKIDNQPDLKAYLIINEEDGNIIDSEGVKNNVLVTSDKKIISNLFNEKFIYTDKDVSTIQSKIILCSENKVIFKSAILISDKKNGIQNKYTGWSEFNNFNNFKEYYNQFKEYYLPIIVFN